MITTVCMNPAFDRTVTVDTLMPGQVNRIRQARTDMGGKGVNVAVVARRLGLDAQCIGCMGEDGAARFVAMMDAEGLPHRFLTVPGTLRTNTKVVSMDGSGVTELNEPGAALTEPLLEEFFRMAEDAAGSSGIAVVTGSLPPGCPEGTYRQLIRRLHVPCVLDVSGRELLLGAETGPMLVKPNIHELEATLGEKLPTQDAVIHGARRLMAMGAQHVLVSMGGDGALMVTADKVWYAPPVSVAVKSTVGAGDAMVGGVLKGLAERPGDMRHALMWGVAAGTASVMTEGTQLIRPEDIAPILAQVHIQEV
ncbi:MAG: 1-phosphofructokinase [Aristaeellaceae bacterium]